MLPALRMKTRESPREGQQLRFREEPEGFQLMIAPKSAGGTIVSPRSTGRRLPKPDSFPDDILGTFEASLRTYEERMKSEETLSIVKPTTISGSYTNPELEKNMKRVNLMSRRLAIESDSRPTSRSGQQPTYYSTNPLDKQYIDTYYPHPSTSRAVNRLPLPSNLEYNIPQIILTAQKAPPSTKYYDSHPNATIEETFARDKDFLLSLMPQNDEIRFERTTTMSARDKKDSQITEGVKLYWTIRPVTGQKPECREGASVCWMDRKLYMFGGQSMTKRNEIRMLNPDTWTWQLIDTQYTPKGRIGHSITSYKRQIILFGGWSHYSQRLRMRRCFKKLYILFLDGEANWQRFRGDGKVPKSRRYHAATSFGSSLLVFGGVDTHSKILGSLYVLDMEALLWRKLKLPGGPAPRSNCTLTTVFHPSLLARSDYSVFAMPKLRMDQILPNSGFYLFGGLDSKAQPLADLWILGQFEAGLVWHKAETSGKEPVPRSDHIAAMVGGYLAVYGGRNDFKAKGSLCLGDISMLKIDTLHWETIVVGGAVPQPRWAHVGAVMGSKLLILGGIDYAHFLPSDLYVVETEQVFVSELFRQENEKQKEVKLQLLRRMSRTAYTKYL